MLYIFNQNSAVNCLYLPFLFKNPFPGQTSDGIFSVIGLNNFVTLLAPKTIGSPEFSESIFSFSNK